MSKIIEVQDYIDLRNNKDAVIERLRARIKEVEAKNIEINKKYNEAIYTMWLLDTTEEAKDLLKKHGHWGKCVQADKSQQSIESIAKEKDKMEALERFICYLIDNYEDDTVTEEWLQIKLADFLKSHYSKDTLACGCSTDSLCNCPENSD